MKRLMAAAVFAMIVIAPAMAQSVVPFCSGDCNLAESNCIRKGAAPATCARAKKVCEKTGHWEVGTYKCNVRFR